MRLIKLGSIILLLMSGKAYTQDGMYTLPIEKARLLVQDAFRARLLDSLNQMKDDRIAELSGELYDCQKLAANAEENFKTTLQAQQGANAELVEDNKGLKKDLKNEKRKGKLARVLLPIVGVGMFLLGSQL